MLIQQSREVFFRMIESMVSSGRGAYFLTLSPSCFSGFAYIRHVLCRHKRTSSKNTRRLQRHLHATSQTRQRRIKIITFQFTSVSWPINIFDFSPPNAAQCFTVTLILNRIKNDHRSRTSSAVFVLGSMAAVQSLEIAISKSPLRAL